MSNFGPSFDSTTPNPGPSATVTSNYITAQTVAGGQPFPAYLGDFASSAALPTSPVPANNTTATVLGMPYVYLSGQGWVASGGGSGSSSYAALTVTGAIQNLTAANTPNLRAMRAGGSRGRIVFLGDSFPEGFGSNGNGLVNSRAGSFPFKLAPMLTGAGIPASANYAIGNGNANADTMAVVASTDPRWTFNGCSMLAGYDSMAGYMIALSTAGDLMTFRPGVTFDTIELYFAMNTVGQGNFIVSVDGGTTTLATITDNISNSVGKQTVTAPAGSTAVTIKKGSASSYIIGVGVRTANAPGIEIINGAMSGGQVQTIAQPTGAPGGNESWNTRTTLAQMCDGNAANLIVINGWYNDQANGRTSSQIATDLTTLITASKAFGDVIYMNYATLDPGSISAANFSLYSTAAINAALACNVPVIDMSKVISNFATGNAAGLYYNSLHLGPTGQPYAAAQLFNVFMSKLLTF